MGRVNIWNDEKVLGKVSGDGYTTFCRYVMPLNCTVKNENYCVVYSIIILQIWHKSNFFFKMKRK